MSYVKLLKNKNKEDFWLVEVENSPGDMGDKQKQLV